MIEIRNVGKNYGPLRVIDDVSFTIEKGEIFGIIGRSGAGKSTLLRCINALEPMSQGEIFVDGVGNGTLSQEGVRLLRRKISMIFQNFNLLAQKTALENVLLPMEIWGIPRETALTKAKALLNLVGLSQKHESKPRAMSGGEKQRVAIARALSLDPEVLLCDEATSALDPNTTKEILALLRKINQELRITIIMVTHQMEVIKEVCQRVAVMEHGVVSALGPVEELFLNPQVHLRNLVGEEELEVLPSGTNIRIFFTQEFSNQSIITGMAKALDVDFSIVWGKLEKINQNVLGSLVINVRGEDRERILTYLKTKQLAVEVIEHEL